MADTGKGTSLPVRVGVFSSLQLADRAVHRLTAAGFEKEAITVICPACAPDAYADYDRKEPAGSRVPVAAAGGGAVGAVLGGLVGLAGVTATGGLGLLAAGPLLAGAGGGAVAGSFIGAMLTRGFEDQMADYYDQALQAGKILVGVESQHAQVLERAERVLAESGAEPVALPKG